MNHHAHLTVPRVLAAAVALTLLASCSGSETATSTDPTSVPGTDATVSTSPTSPPTTIEPTVTTASAPPTTAAPPATAAPQGADCLVGDWIVSEAVLNEYFDTVALNAGFESIDSVGVMRISFTGSIYEWQNDFRQTLVLDEESTFQTVQSGGITGTYTESNGVLTGSLDVDTRGGVFSLNGVPFTEDSGDLFVDVSPARPLDSLPYSCDGPTLTLGAGPRAGAQLEITLAPA